MLRRMVLLLALTVPMAAMAVEPDEILDDPALEARAREVSKGLRCVVCLNQDIDSSNAGVARDLRLLVRERIVAGDSNSETLAFIQARYGDYVLLKPPLNMQTFALWIAPPAMFVIAIGMGWAILMRRRKKVAGAMLSEAEEQEVRRFIEKQKAENNT